MRWSQRRTRAKSFLAESVKARVDFHTTEYHRAKHTLMGRGWITVDGIELINMPTYRVYIEKLRSHMAESKQDYHTSENWLTENSVFAQHELTEAIDAQINGSIDQLLASEKPLFRAIAMLDRRVGKRRLLRIDPATEHPLVATIHALRFEAENWRYPWLQS